MIRKLSPIIAGRMRWRCPRRTDRRLASRGSITLEFLLAMPLIFIATLAIFEFGFLALLQQTATTATIEGAREGAKRFPSTYQLNTPGANNDIADAVVVVVNEYLAVQGLEIVDLTQGYPSTTRANAAVLIEYQDANGNYSSTIRGTPPPRGPTRTGPALNNSEIVVTLAFQLVDPSQPSGNGHPLPDWLATFGFSLSGYEFEMSARASLE